MRYEIFSRESNPGVDAPLFFASKSRLEMLLATGAVEMVGDRRAQYICEQRDPEKRKRDPKGYINWAGKDTCVGWAMVNRSTFPQFQMVCNGAKYFPKDTAFHSNARRGINHFLMHDYNRL